MAPSKALVKPGQRVTNDITVQTFNATATSIAGTATNLHAQLAELEADLKKDIEGKKEYEAYLKRTLAQKADLEKRITSNKAWINSFEKNDTAGAFEEKYKQLVSQIESIYANAKEFHGKGIDMLIKEFDYHVTYKRWNDTFTATPFTPK